MDLDSQDWLIVIGALLIVGVLLDAWRRYRNDRRNPIRIARKTMGPGGGFARDEPDPASSELPGGGARVVVRDADSPEPPRAPVPRRREARVEPRVEAPKEPRMPEAAPVPPAPAGIPDSVQAASAAEPVAATEPDTLDVPASRPDASIAHAPRVAVPASALAEIRPAAPVAPERDVLFVRVVSRGDGGFSGPDLARIFKECDVRLGPQKVFQRTELARGEGPVQFTVFNGTNQGVFDAALDESFATRGLGFLMRLGEAQKPHEAFDCMLETARAVAKYCDGELRDDSNSVFTQQTGEHCRERISDFALRARARR